MLAPKKAGMEKWKKKRRQEHLEKKHDKRMNVHSLPNHKFGVCQVLLVILIQYYTNHVISVRYHWNIRFLFLPEFKNMSFSNLKCDYPAI